MPAPYPEPFRREAVELLRRSGKSVPVLARELGVSPQSLRNWARQIDVDEGRRDGLSSDEREELRRVRRANRILTEEREILKKCPWPPWRPPVRGENPWRWCCSDRRRRRLVRSSP